MEVNLGFSTLFVLLVDDEMSSVARKPWDFLSKKSL